MAIIFMSIHLSGKMGRMSLRVVFGVPPDRVQTK